LRWRREVVLQLFVHAKARHAVRRLAEEGGRELREYGQSKVPLSNRSGGPTPRYNPVTP
jgi:hypothetical protein